MKKLLSPRWLLVVLTGLLFAAYSAYMVFVIIRDAKSLSIEGYLINGCVALMFALCAVYLWTAGIKGKKHIIFMMVRRTTLIIALLVIFLLKLRIAVQVINFMDYTKPYTLIYGWSYFLTLAALAILLGYYVFILKSLPFHPKAALFLPRTAVILFLLCLILDAVLFFGFGIMLDGNVIRTVVSRPIFYFSFIGLAIHFLYPMQAT